MRTQIRTRLQSRAAWLALRCVFSSASIAAIAGAASFFVHHSTFVDHQSSFITQHSSFIDDSEARFRFGDAAQPFGWATAVGDFNTDGRADVAIADHIRSRSGQYAYRIEFAVSGQNPSRVTFESTHDAIAINLADVDRDDDLDVVVRTAVSGETVGVWLNDGRGHFTAGDVHQVPDALAPVASVSTTDPECEGAAFEALPRRHLAALSLLGSPVPASAVACVPDSADRSPSSFHTRRQHSRAPPAVLPTFLN